MYIIKNEKVTTDFINFDYLIMETIKNNTFENFKYLLSFNKYNLNSLFLMTVLKQRHNMANYLLKNSDIIYYNINYKLLEINGQSLIYYMINDIDKNNEIDNNYRQTAKKLIGQYKRSIAKEISENYLIKDVIGIVKDYI